MNKVILCGRLTREVEMKDTKSGMQVARVGIAVDRRGKKDEADFFNLVAFDKTAAFMLKYLHRGERVLIEGRLQTSSYEKDGVKRTSVDVIVENVEFADGKKDAKPAGDTFKGSPVDDDDTPF